MLISLYPTICLTVASSSSFFFFSFLLYQILECTTPKFFDQLQNKHEPQLLDSWRSSLGQPLYGIGSTLITLKESDVDQTPCCVYHSWVLAICNYQFCPMYNHFGILMALMVPTLDMRAMPPVHFVPIIGLTTTYRLPLLMKPTTYIPSFNPLVISLVQIAANLFLYLC